LIAAAMQFAVLLLTGDGATQSLPQLSPVPGMPLPSQSLPKSELSTSALLSRAQGEPGASAWSELDFARVRLIAGAAATGTLERVPVGLEFRMEPGWKIYWRTPGDAGYPPRLDWTGSTNLADAAILWPAPDRFSLFGLETAGYGGEITLPILVAPQQAGGAVALNARVDFLTCKDICVPLEASLALDLPAGAAAPTRFAHQIDQFKARVPVAGDAGGIVLDHVETRGQGSARHLIIAARAEAPFTGLDAFIEGPPGLSYGKPKVSYRDDGRHARLSLPVYGPDATALARAALTVTLTDGSDAATRRAIEQRVTVAPPPPAAPLAVMLGLAVLGGLILNLMPCVLPVLALKLAGAVGLSGQSARQVRAGFLAAAAGILVSFMALAGALAALKAGGIAIGWGIQFQQPIFLVAMTALVTLFAANLWGWFEVPLPALFGDAALAGSAARGLLGHFLTGVFATLLATPCSAPFLGTAVGFALAGGTGEIVVIFAMLGLGLALPYLAVAAWPRVALALPRPGPWMVWLRRLLGLALAATALWLLNVLAAQQDGLTARLVGGAMLALLTALALARVIGRLAGGMLAVIAVVTAMAVPLWRDDASPPSARDEPAQGAVAWVPFDRVRIGPLVAEGRTVLVDVTADWCLTCQVNKRLVLERGEIAKRLGGDVVAMRADWTRPSATIADYLASFGRYGIPFNAVYGPGAPEGIALPELLTDSAVLAALEQAARPVRQVAK